MKAIIIVSKNNKNYGYGFKTKKIGKEKFLKYIKEVCKEQNYNVVTMIVTG